MNTRANRKIPASRTKKTGREHRATAWQGADSAAALALREVSDQATEELEGVVRDGPPKAVPGVARSGVSGGSAEGWLTHVTVEQPADAARILGFATTCGR